MSALQRPWVRRGLAIVVVLAALAPAFAWAAGAVGYSEPLENAAERTGASEHAEAAPSLLAGYAVPGLGDPIGTLGAALLGSGLTLAVALGIGRLLD